MIEINFTPFFVKKFKSFEKDLREEALEKIELFRLKDNHTQLKVHKLNGNLKGKLSFSINYKYRIVFEYLDKNTVILHSMGDHDVYKN
ncbi:MAG: type II toxin-antitoxin system mRNA interferase toxin, RelE/StbE family [Candidatus Taylorbacteria bacterium]|nr:type II toxin-antitoxin system mRNA interferase toxin, RelE/StbE family [Candidatus Taylorbacteria bacterium]